MRSSSRGLALRPLRIVLVGTLSIFIYAALLAINLKGADAQVRALEQLASVQADAASLRSTLSRFVFLDGRFASRRELSPRQIELLRNAKDVSFASASAMAKQLQDFGGKDFQPSVLSLLTELNAASVRRASLQDDIYQENDGLMARFVAARRDADEIFTRISEEGPIPARDYLVARNAQNEFLRDFSETAVPRANAALASFISRTATFPGLTSKQRSSLAGSAEVYRTAFEDLSRAHLEFRVIGERIQSQIIAGAPALAELEEAVQEKSSRLREQVTDTRQTLEIATAAVAAFTGLALAIRVRL